jgi:hypothetical protein
MGMWIAVMRYRIINCVHSDNYCMTFMECHTSVFCACSSLLIENIKLYDASWVHLHNVCRKFDNDFSIGFIWKVILWTNFSPFWLRLRARVCISPVWYEMQNKFRQNHLAIIDFNVSMVAYIEIGLRSLNAVFRCMFLKQLEIILIM